MIKNKILENNKLYTYFNHMNFPLLIAYIGTTFFSIRLIPQIYETIKTKSRKGLSSSFIILDLLSTSCFAIYTYVIFAIPLLIANLVSVISNIILLCFYYIIAKKE